MLTPTELKGKQFSKAMFGGYAMAEVDKLLDQLTPDYERLYTENAELRKKVEVLIAQVEAFQEQEDSIKAAILNAQRMCDNIVAQAKQQASLIEQDARAKSERLAEQLERGIADKREEYDVLCAEVTAFRGSLVELYRDHLEKIREIPVFSSQEAEDLAPEAAQEMGDDEAALQNVPPAEDAGFEQRIAQQFSDLEKTIEFSLPGQGPDEAPETEIGEALGPLFADGAAEAADPDDAGDADPGFEDVVEVLEEPEPAGGHLSYAIPAFEEGSRSYGGELHLKLEDSLEFGTEFDIATGSRRTD
ncbi:MAG: DivIVA domain-containing protein [Clostridiales bacterium]|nr:DivIVA domain-containing protein [Clostridiales bacterium]